LELLGTEDEYSNAPADTSCTDSPIRSPVLACIYKTQQITFLQASDLKEHDFWANGNISLFRLRMTEFIY